MAFEMGWTPDYCLSCDKQTSSGAPYCSQTCRLADLESTSKQTSIPASPNLFQSVKHSQPSSSPLELSSGFQLPLAYNFTAHVESSRYVRSSTGRIEIYTPQPRYTSTTRTSVFSSPPKEASRPLVTSNSQSSLTSLRSSSSTESFALSDKAQRELRDYASAFDQVRNWKRRISSS